MRLAALFIAICLGGAAAEAAAERAPTGKWIVNFAEAQCVAYRDYGTPAKPLRLLLKAPAVGDIVQVAVKQRASASPPEQAKAIVKIDGGPPLRTSLLNYTPKGSKERIYLLNMPSADFAPVRRAKTLSVRSEGLDATFALSGMEPLMKVVDECVADLRATFNVGSSGEEPAKLESRATGNIASYFSSDDYPYIAVMRDQSGRVGFALLIGEDGRVADCTIVSTSGVPVLDVQVCSVLQSRARLKPAIGIDGKPAKDSLLGTVIWRMP